MDRLVNIFLEEGEGPCSDSGCTVVSAAITLEHFSSSRTQKSEVSSEMLLV